MSMQPGQRLTPGQEIRANGVTLRYQEDGNLVLYDRVGPRWASDTHGRSAGHVDMQGDGFLVIYDAADVPIWRSGDVAVPGSRLLIDDTGLRVVATVDLPTWQVRVPPREPWERPAPGTHIDPLVGQVGLMHGAFADGRGPRNICSFHAGDWIGQAMRFGPGHIAGAVDYLASIGVHVARCWFQLKTIPGRSPFWDSKPAPRWNPADDPQAFKAAIEVFTSRGIKLHLAGGGIKDMSNAEEDAAFGVLRDTVAEFGPEYFALIEACNEIRDTGDEDDIDPRELTRLVNIVRDRFPQILYGLSAYTGTEDRATTRTYTPDWMRFFIQHDYRGGRFHDKARHLFSGAYEGVVVRRNCWRGEPFGVVGKSRLVSAQANGHELDAHTMPMAAAMAAMTRSVWTYMSGPGVIFGVEPIEDLPGLPETPAMMRALPQDVGTFDTLGHSGPSRRGQRIHAVREDAPDVRADYAIGNDGRYVEIIYGPPDQRKDLPQERRTTADQVLLDGPWGRVITGRLA